MRWADLTGDDRRRETEAVTRRRLELRWRRLEKEAVEAAVMTVLAIESRRLRQAARGKVR